MLLWGGAIGGVVAAVSALRRPAERRQRLLLAAVLFLPIGVLGILSIGLIFLLASVLCLVGAAASSSRHP